MPITPDTQKALYRARIEESRYDEAVDEVARELENHIRYHRYIPPSEIERSIVPRVKDLERILEKVDRGRRRPRLVTSLPELESIVTDIAGVRIVLDRLDLVKKTGQFIEDSKRWRVVKIQRKKRGDTGYRSLHIDVLLSTTHHGDVRCEIQCRTLLEQAFALWTTSMYEHYRANPKSVPGYLLGRVSQISDDLHHVDKQVNLIMNRYGRIMK